MIDFPADSLPDFSIDNRLPGDLEENYIFFILFSSFLGEI